MLNNDQHNTAQETNDRATQPHYSCNSLKIFEFSTLYTTIPHSHLKDRLKELVQLCFIKRNGQRRYKYIVVGMDRSYFVKNPL
jgi:hypothetical protein